MTELLGNALILGGALFYLAGTLGLLRFPDVFTRLHAVAKVDNLGLGLTTLGLVLQAPPAVVAKLVLIWILVLTASAAVSFLIARRALARGVVPWRAAGSTQGRDP